MNRDLRFAVLSDIHLTESGPRHPDRLAIDSVRIFEEAREDAEALEPDFIFYTGDLFEARDLALPQLELARRVLGKTRVPWFVLAGNHDARYKSTRDGYHREDFIRAFEGHGPTRGRAYWSHDLADSPFAFVGLDSSREFTSCGGVGPEQLAWLRSELKRFAGRQVIILMHHPAVVFDQVLRSHPELAVYYLENHEEVRDVLVENRCVKLAISGHNHTRRHEEIEGLHFVGVPSINSWPNMYASFELSEGRAAVAFHRIRDRAKVEEAYAGLVHPESPMLKAFKNPAELSTYFSTAPSVGKLELRDARQI